MLEDHFGLERAPFRLGTDASFYYEAEAHRRAMAHLRYGLRQSEGFVVITGEPGVGKTMVVEQLLMAVQDTDVLAGMLVPGGLTAANLAERVLAAFDRRPLDDAEAIDSLRDYLADERRRGAKASLIIDEAQHLSDALLEELRLLSDLTHDGDALLQVCLIGQTALRRVLFRDDMEQLRQRIVASYHLSPLSAEDTEAYIGHRMKAAGYRGDDVFTPEALGAIHRLTGGVPRRINTLCARLLAQAEMNGRFVVDADDAQSSAGEVVDDAQGSAGDVIDHASAKTSPPVAADPEPVPEPDPKPAVSPRPSLKLVQTPTPPAGPRNLSPTRTDDRFLVVGDEGDDEEAEAERALALVTATPRTTDDEAKAQPEGPTQSQPGEVPEGPAAPKSYHMRAQSGAARNYPVSVGDINAAIRSIDQGGVVEVPGPTAKRSASTQDPAARPRMRSPQELMLRSPAPPRTETVQPTPAPNDDASTEAIATPTDDTFTSPPQIGERERALLRFLKETESALAELRQTMDELRARVDTLDADRRAQRARIEKAAEEARERLDALRLER